MKSTTVSTKVIVYLLLVLLRDAIAFSPPIGNASRILSVSTSQNKILASTSPFLKTSLPNTLEIKRQKDVKMYAAPASLPVKAALNAVGGSFLPFLKNLHADPTFVLSAILLLSTFGISLERRTTIGKALSVSNIYLAHVTYRTFYLP